MKKLAVCVLLILVPLLAFGETYKIGFFALEPYVISAEGSGSPSGAAVDLWNEYLVPKLGIDLEWIGPLPFQRLLDLMERKEVDIILIAARNPERERVAYFPEQPYITMAPSITTLKSNNLGEIRSLDDLHGLVLGYFAGAFLPPFMVNDAITIDASTATDYVSVNYQKLTRHRIDGIFDLNTVTYLYEAKKRGLGNQVEVLKLPVDPTPIYSVFVKNARGQALVNSYSSILKSLSPDVIDKLVLRYTE